MSDHRQRSRSPALPRSPRLNALPSRKRPDPPPNPGVWIVSGCPTSNHSAQASEGLPRSRQGSPASVCKSAGSGCRRRRPHDPASCPSHLPGYMHLSSCASSTRNNGSPWNPYSPPTPGIQALVRRIPRCLPDPSSPAGR